MEKKSLKDLALSSVTIVVYGKSGSGKTRLIASLPRPFIISVEKGLLSLAGEDIDFTEIASFDEFIEAYTTLLNTQDQWDSLCIDSISELAEILLAEEKKLEAKDQRRAYQKVQETMYSLFRALREDFPGKIIYLTTKVDKDTNLEGLTQFAPMMPGNKIAQNISYFFDEVFALRQFKNQEGVVESWLMCRGDEMWLAKDRSGRLSDYEPFDLGAIVRKIRGKA